jgi:hypothetical protein
MLLLFWMENAIVETAASENSKYPQVKRRQTKNFLYSKNTLLVIIQ